MLFTTTELRGLTQVCSLRYFENFTKTLDDESYRLFKLMSDSLSLF